MSILISFFTILNVTISTFQLHKRLLILQPFAILRFHIVLHLVAMVQVTSRDPDILAIIHWRRVPIHQRTWALNHYFQIEFKEVSSDKKVQTEEIHTISSKHSSVSLIKIVRFSLDIRAYMIKVECIYVSPINFS